MTGIYFVSIVERPSLRPFRKLPFPSSEKNIWKFSSGRSLCASDFTKVGIGFPVCVESPGFTYVSPKGGLLFFELEIATWKAVTSLSTPDYTTNQRSHLLDSRSDFRSHAEISLQVEFLNPRFHAEIISNDSIQSKLSRFGNPTFLTREIFYHCISTLYFFWVFRTDITLHSAKITALYDAFQMIATASHYRFYTLWFADHSSSHQHLVGDDSEHEFSWGLSKRSTMTTRKFNSLIWAAHFSVLLF